MEISVIKLRLSLATILTHYGLKPDKNNILRCPFHPDKTPSMQIFYKTNTVYCFSSNCKTNGKSLDVIDFVMYMEGFDTLEMTKGKHKACLKCVEMINENPQPAGQSTQLTKTILLEKTFACYKNALNNSIPAKEYLQSRALDYTKIEVGYNDDKAPHINTFGKHCIIFPLKNQQGGIVSLYGRSIAPEQNNLVEKDNKKEGNSLPAGQAGKHFYQKNRSGLYPHYPEPTTKKLLLTESIIDAVTLLQVPEITQQHNILACYGTNGLTAEHTASIKELTELEEIIFAFDNDKSGKVGAEKYSKELHELLPHITISQIELP